MALAVREVVACGRQIPYKAPVSEEKTHANGKPPRRLLDADLLRPIERNQIKFVRGTFESPRADRTVRFLQRHVGANWIEACIKNLRHVLGTERLPAMHADQSFIIVCNHRSFFDLYVVTGFLVKRGLQHRLVFPVRSHFFYDHPLGWFVNGVMSFFAMYPPIFRDAQRAALNLAGIDETVELVRRGSVLLGLHPEGTRNKGDDPYALLPAQSGVGRIIQKARVPVIPVFVNGLGNDFVKQITSNFTRGGDPVVVVFGAPVDFGDLLERPASPRVHKQIAERAVQAVSDLGQEERQYRGQLGQR